MDFVQGLPTKLKIELSCKIHHETILKVPFFQDRTKEFIAFVTPLLQPEKVKENYYMYKENGQVDKVYFLYSGILGYVLPDMGDSIFGLGETGDLIGLIDLIPDEDLGEVVGNTKRKFTV